MSFVKFSWRSIETYTYAAASVIVGAAAILPLLAGSANAAQITSRSLTLGSGVPSAVTTYAFSFQLPSATTVKSFSAQACTAAVGACSTPAGFSITGSTISVAPANMGSGGAWTVNTGTAGQLRMANGSNTGSPTGTSTVTFGSVTNPSTANTAFFLRLTTYSDATWTTAIDTGTTAAAVVQTLSVNAAVAEILNFCVGNTGVDNMTSDPTSGSHDCTSISGTSVNLGTLDTGHVNVTPVSSNCTAGDCSKNGIAMVRSNAGTGVIIYYDTLSQSGTNHTRALRVAGDTCDAANPSTSITDTCFNSKGWNGSVATAGTLTAGTESFGMTIPGINCGSTTSYTCTGSSNSNLVRQSNYNGDGSTNTYTAEANQAVTTTTTNKYAWDESGSAIPIASSASSATKVVDDEALILKFAGTPSITTPFGSYTAKADFTAVATY